MSKAYKILLFLVIVFVIVSCSDDYIPKPIGYFRIHVPEHGYKKLDNPNLPYTFEYADYAKINRRFDRDSNWVNIEYPQFKGAIFLTYHKMDTSLMSYIEDCHDMAYKHTAKATNIENELIVLDSVNIYGLIYYIEGDQAASPLNFYLTDSVNHFLRGALYFNMEPRNDSLRPVIRSIEKDVEKLILSFRFKE